MDAATTMLHEAMNGVFCCLYRRSAQLGYEFSVSQPESMVGYSLRKCQDVASLNTFSLKRSKYVHDLDVIF